MRAKAVHNLHAEFALSARPANSKRDGERMRGIFVAIPRSEIVVERMLVFFLETLFRIEIANAASETLLQCFEAWTADIFFWQWKSGNKYIGFANAIKN